MTDDPLPAILDAEIVRRRAALEQAEHSGEMEGHHIIAAIRADGEDEPLGASTWTNPSPALEHDTD